MALGLNLLNQQQPAFTYIMYTLKSLNPRPLVSSLKHFAQGKIRKRKKGRKNLSGAENRKNRTESEKK